MRLTGVCIDCADAEELAEFYGRLLGWEVTAGGGNWIQLADPASRSDRVRLHLNIQAEEWYEPPVWPEHPGAPAKMLHFEIEVDDMEAAVARAVEAGARIAEHQPVDRDQTRLRVMLDPAGHPFCLFID
jgi:catechol 2,3-dioxygenase-like lactoylglutathione lyase family enzyme